MSINRENGRKSSFRTDFLPFYLSINFWTEEENILLKDVSDAEVNDFIESLNTQQFGKVREYVENMPRVEKQIKFICGGCEKENNITLSGIDDFF